MTGNCLWVVSFSMLFVCTVTLMKITSRFLTTSCRNQLIPEVHILFLVHVSGPSLLTMWLLAYQQGVYEYSVCVLCVPAWHGSHNLPPADDSDQLCFVSAGTTRQLRTGLRNTPCDPPSHHLLLEINRFFSCGLSSAICSHYFVPFSTLNAFKSFICPFLCLLKGCETKNHKPEWIHRLRRELLQ